MTRLKYIIIATIGLLLTAISCSDGDEIVRNLDVDKDHLVFTQKEQTQIVKVAVEKGANFTAVWEGEPWGSAIVNVQDMEIRIKVNQNANPSLRRSSVVVSLENGIRNKVIDIIQNGNDPQLSTVPEEIAFNFLAEKQIIEVESNVNWAVEKDKDAEWLDVKSFVQSGEIVITAAENFDLSERITTLIITAGSSSKAVLVQQVSPPIFLLPYLDISSASIQVVEDFETARHSTFIQGMSGGIPHRAITKSPLIHEINYTISGKRVSIAIAKVNAKLMPDFFGSEGNKGKSHEFLLANDFEYLFLGRDYMTKVPVESYWLDLGGESKSHYLATVNPKTSVVKYDMASFKPDDPNHPTFDPFPYPPFSWGTAQAPIDAWEAANGGTLSDEDDVGAIHQVTYLAADPYYMRSYHYENDELIYIMYLFHDYKKIETKEYLGTYSTNEKFAELLLKEGFTATGARRSYANQAKDIALVAGAAQIETGGAYFGAMEFRPYSTLEGIGSADKSRSEVKYLPYRQ